MGSTKVINSSRNLLYGILLKIYQMIMPFIIRTIIIKKLGIDYGGLNSLFVSILQVLNVAELGVGAALVFSMYKPIYEKNTAQICALMNLYKRYYRIIGFVILGIGCMLLPVLTKLINGEVPRDINIYILYVLNLGATVLSYWLFAYKNSLFIAHQRGDVISKITIAINSFMYLTQIILLLTLSNYYIYVIIILCAQMAINISTAIAADKTYPHYRPEGELSISDKKQIDRSIKDLFFAQVGYIITSSVDSIVISAFLGLTQLAIYQNYYYILNALIGFYTIFFQAIRASIGTNMIQKSKHANYEDFKFITFVIMSSLAYCMSCLICMYQVFMDIWMGKENMLDYYCVILFAVYLFVFEVMWLLSSYKDATGKWHADRFRHLITAFINLLSNVILVKWIGIYGVLLSTIGSYILVNIPWLYSRVFIDAFDKSYIRDYTKYLVKFILIAFSIVSSNIILCNLISISNKYVHLLFNFGICSIITISLVILFNINDKSYKRLIGLLITRFNKILKKV